MGTTSGWSPQPFAGANTLRDRAYEAIKAGILSLELEPGAPLVEATLAERLGVSKSPVRDALHRLEREGLAVREPFKGVQVASLSREDILDAFAVRGALEELAVRRAAERITEEQVQETRGLISAGMAAVADGDALEVERLIDSFHRAVVEAADTPLLTFLLGSVYDRLARARAFSVRIGSGGEASMREHAQILDAIAVGDADGAVAASRAHAARLLKEFSDALSPSEPMGAS